MAVLRRKGGSYVIDFTSRGRRRRVSAGPERREALRLLKEINREIVRQKLALPTQDADAAGALQEFLDDRRNRNTPGWTKYQEQMIRDFLTFSGVRRLRNIVPADITRWQSHRRSKTSLATARKYVRVLRTWLRWCVRWGYLFQDPTDRVERLPMPPRREPDFLTEPQIEALFKACRAPVPMHGPGKKGRRARPRKTPIYEAAALALYAGLRLGEIRHLQWKDLELDGEGEGSISVRVTDHFVPKDKEHRRIPMHPRLREILLAYRQAAQNGPGFVFASPSGQPPDRGNLDRGMRGAVKRADLKVPCNFTILRHTFASWLTMKGVPMHHISKLMGHSSVTTTERHYAALSPETLYPEICRLPSILGR